MNTAAKGRSFEHSIRHLFESAGFSVVRGAASKGEMIDEKVDLVATRLTRDTEYTAFLYIIGVQCKAKSRPKEAKND